MLFLALLAEQDVRRDTVILLEPVSWSMDSPKAPHGLRPASPANPRTPRGPPSTCACFLLQFPWQLTAAPGTGVVASSFAAVSGVACFQIRVKASREGRGGWGERVEGLGCKAWHYSEFRAEGL